MLPPTLAMTIAVIGTSRKGVRSNKAYCWYIETVARLVVDGHDALAWHAPYSAWKRSNTA